MDKDAIKTMIGRFVEVIDALGLFTTVIVSTDDGEAIASNMPAMEQEKIGDVAFISLVAATSVENNHFNELKFLSVMIDSYPEAYAKILASRQFIVAATSEIQH